MENVMLLYVHRIALENRCAFDGSNSTYVWHHKNQPKPKRHNSYYLLFERIMHNSADRSKGGKQQLRVLILQKNAEWHTDRRKYNCAIKCQAAGSHSKLQTRGPFIIGVLEHSSSPESIRRRRRGYSVSANHGTTPTAPTMPVLFTMFTLPSVDA